MVHRDTGSPDIAAARRQYLRMNRTATVAMDWRHRIDIRTAKTDRPPADALLIRPDACIAWAAATGEPAGAAAPALREALGYWFGPPTPPESAL